MNICYLQYFAIKEQCCYALSCTRLLAFLCWVTDRVSYSNVQDAKLFSKWFISICILTSGVWSFLLFHILINTWYWVFIFPDGYKRIVHYDPNLIFSLLMSLFSCLFSISTLFSKKCRFISFAHYFVSHLSSFWCTGILHITWIPWKIDLYQGDIDRERERERETYLLCRMYLYLCPFCGLSFHSVT